MTTVYIADTGVFVRCGDPGNEKFQRLRRAVRQTGVSLVGPRRVYEELGGDPAAEAYPSGNIPYPKGFEEGWIVVADELDYTDPLVSTVMDDTRRWIANETDRDEDTVEKADTALIGLAAQLLDAGESDDIVLLTTDSAFGFLQTTNLTTHLTDSELIQRFVRVSRYFELKSKSREYWDLGPFYNGIGF